MKSDNNARDRTRRAILEAMADVITDTSGIGFSVQAVADRAGVTHRTVYNHFPTREALCEGFSAYVDELLVSTGTIDPPPAVPQLEELPVIINTLYKALALRERYARAYVMLMIGNRTPLGTWRARTRSFEQQIAKKAGATPVIAPRLAAAAVRMFASTMGWHLLTEQCGLSTGEAAAACEWATRTLLDSATTHGRSPAPSRAPKRGSHAIRRRRT
jgi:AcrR family transcriptional regulator